MDQKRKGEIALILLKVLFRKKGLHTLSRPELKREAGNLAKETGISEEELMEFAKSMIFELIGEMFPED